MSNLMFKNLIKNTDDNSLINMYKKYQKEISFYKNELAKSLIKDKENRYINVKLNELTYLFTLENLNCILKEINKRGILV
ncbi:MAG: hypothetical protein ACK5LY_10800 [Lachnospirales bacterium]